MVVAVWVRVASTARRVVKSMMMPRFFRVMDWMPLVAVNSKALVS